MTPETSAVVISIIQAVSVIVAVFAILLGIGTWRREFKGKRRLELIEDVLARFYEVEDAIKDIRNPMGWSGDGESRKIGDSEPPELTKALNQAFVVFERYNKHQESFSQLRTIRYRAMATFGAQIRDPFDDVNKAVNSVFVAAKLLGQLWAKKVLSESDLDRIEKYEAKFWEMGDATDEVSHQVQSAVAAIEVIAKTEAERNVLKGWIVEIRHAFS